MGLLQTFFGAATGGAAAPIGAVANLANSVIDKIWPDENSPARLEAKLKLAELEQNGDLKTLSTLAGLDQGQIEVNKIEAASNSLFVAGWRPALGWVCVIALFVYYVPRFLLGMLFWGMEAWGSETLPVMPEMGIMDILGLVATLLGSSTIRFLEKKNGVAR